MKWEISKFIPYKHQLEMFIVNFGENLLAYLLVGNLGKLKEHLYFIFFLKKQNLKGSCSLGQLFLTNSSKPYSIF